jgi:hypothetical protein
VIVSSPVVDNANGATAGFKAYVTVGALVTATNVVIVVDIA